MNFRDFVKKDELRPSNRNRYYEDQEDQDELVEDNEEFEEELDEDYEEPIVQERPQRIVQRTVQRPQVVQNRQTYRQIPQKRIVCQAMPIEQYNRPIQVTKKALQENTIENTANTLTEAIKRKVDTIFYRFGIQGLEKLDEKILDTIEELECPDTKTPIKKSGANMRRIPAKKPIRKVKPLPIKEIQKYKYEEPEQEFVEEQYEPIEELEEQKIQDVQVVENDTNIDQEEQMDISLEPIEESVEEQEPNIMELASKILDIAPEQELKHEANGSNPVFENTQTVIPPIVQPSTENLVFDVPPIESSKFINMPEIPNTETKEETEELTEQVEQPKKTRKKKEKATNEEK